jgi:hypothetical protein
MRTRLLLPDERTIAAASEPSVRYTDPGVPVPAGENEQIVEALKLTGDAWGGMSWPESRSASPAGG